ncbi:unnamed protein product [Cylicocyclus nassatus]|uniref:SH3 domain-containing protein n=1 Tax=Cylicocyclus nassatus TaxID=53992 RepID=A0AA36GND6_CYLNA|nr:unnamed protein product [Cylicocyclus nassatus]
MGIRRIVSKLLKGSESSKRDGNGWKEGADSSELKPFTAGRVTKRFKATVADELTVSKGTKVRAIYREDNWIYVHASDGKRGFVPESYCRLDNGSPKAVHLKGNTSKIQKRTSKRENEVQTTVMNGYLHDDLNKSSLERFIDSLPVRKDEGQSFQMREHGKARVLHRYEAMRADDVNVWMNDEVVVLNTDDPEWTYVSTEDQLEGFVPAQHLDFGKKVTVKASKVQEHRLVVEDFDGRHALDISVEQGEWVTVVSDDPEGWMWVKRMRDGREGFLPSRIAILATNL